MIDRLDFVTPKHGGSVMAVIGGATDPATGAYAIATCTWFDGSERRMQAIPVEDLVPATEKPSAALVQYLIKGTRMRTPPTAHPGYGHAMAALAKLEAMVQT